MSAYATTAQFEAFTEGWVTDDAAALGRLLERATSDVDEVVGPLAYRTTGTWTGRKLDPVADLGTAGAEALARATCAQALYRFRVVEPAAAPGATGAVKSVSGPDFTTTYADPAPGPIGVAGTGRFSPELRRELAPLAYLRRTGARSRA